MAIHPGRIVKQRGRPQENLLKTGRLPAPVKGIDTRAPIGSTPAANCVYCFNIVPAELGLQVRNGYREHQNDISDTASIGVRSIIVFTGSDPGVADDKLFCATNEGIWDITVAGATPVLKFTFPSQVNDAGHGVHLIYTDQAGANFIYYADAENGLIIYTASTDTWAAAVQADYTGITVANVVFVMEHKQRVWMIEKNSTIGWYSPVAAILGLYTEFYFGDKLPHGGRLEALINWSVDGGVGLDDYLIVVGSAGDVVPYQGSDPSSTDGGTSGGVMPWQSRGTYFVGRIPKGRRFFSEYAGNLYLLSVFGLNSMADLLRGADTKDIAAQSLTYPIARIIRPRLNETADELGWEPQFLPNQGILLVSAPVAPDTGQRLQYSMALATEGWGIWRGVPIDCFREWRGVTYFGSVANIVYSMDVNRDNVLLDDQAEGAIGAAIKFSLLSAYTDGGSPAEFKNVQFVRPDFLATNPPSVQTKVLYDYNIIEFTPNITATPATFGLWDVGLWDEALWSGGLSGFNTIQGGCGIGRNVAIALQGESSDQTSLMSIDVLWTVGGVV